VKKNHAVQNLVLNPGGSLPEELFSRGDGHYERGKLVLEEGREISLNTYFNLFFAAQWKELTEIRAVRFRLRLRGTGRVQIWHADDKGKEKMLKEVPFSLERESSFFVGDEFSLEKLDHACWLRLLADRGTVRLAGGSIVTGTEPQQEPNMA